jgi:hypothetical protein
MKFYTEPLRAEVSYILKIYNPQGIKDDEISYKSFKPRCPCVRIRHVKKRKILKLILNLLEEIVKTQTS